MLDGARLRGIADERRLLGGGLIPGEGAVVLVGGGDESVGLVVGHGFSDGLLACGAHYTQCSPRLFARKRIGRGRKKGAA